MKVYSCPTWIPFAETDYANYDFEKEQAREARHQADLKTWLMAAGYEGENTGRIYVVPVADGHAGYMFADKGEDSALIHLPYGDAYQALDVQYVPRDEILRRLDAQDRRVEALKKAAEAALQADDGLSI